MSRERSLTPREPSRHLGFRSLESDQPEPIELELAGTIPNGLEGTLYRNGPARWDIFGERLEHWFDGDGMVHAFTLDKGKVEYRARFVESTGFREERAAGRRIFGRFATRPAGGPLARFSRRARGKTSQNTSVHLHACALLALSEGGWPMRMDPSTLASLGEDDLGGVLEPGDGYSAHPRFDPVTGDMWNFVSAYGREPRTRIVRRDKNGEGFTVASFPMPQPAMVHDFALTPRFALVEFDPYILPRIPIGLILGQKSFGRSLRWRPEVGGRIAMVPRDGSAPRLVGLAPRLAVHVIHAFEEQDDVVIDAIAYPNADVMQAFREAMVGPIRTPAFAFPERLRIRASGSASVERLSDVPMELPTHLAPVGVPHRYVWGVAWRDPVSVPSIPALLDVETRRTVLAPMREGEIAGECVPVRKRGAKGDGEAWLLTVVLDTERGRSELRVLDGEDLSAPPLVTAVVPHAIPLGFHGSFAAIR